MAAKDKQPDQPQLYLITPAEFELDVFPDLLASVWLWPLKMSNACPSRQMPCAK